MACIYLFTKFPWAYSPKLRYNQGQKKALGQEWVSLATTLLKANRFIFIGEGGHVRTYVCTQYSNKLAHYYSVIQCRNCHSIQFKPQMYHWHRRHISCWWNRPPLIPMQTIFAFTKNADVEKIWLTRAVIAVHRQMCINLIPGRQLMFPCQIVGATACLADMHLAAIKWNFVHHTDRASHIWPCMIFTTKGQLLWVWDAWAQASKLPWSQENNRYFVPAGHFL